MISPTLNVPQARFLSMPHKFKAYIAGFGSGKTWVGCGGICKGIWEHPGINQGYFAPTYPQIRDIFYPTVEEVAADWGLNVKINEGNKGGCCQLTDLVYDGVFEVLQWLLFLSA
ncbi:terminase large subunit domain-containing protein, partial [Escherichia coli]|uniref:terminase large subunit domain-containing protein n=1 Tax=Escherichia coli TaxID=562 RepID=UPI00207CD573